MKQKNKTVIVIAHYGIEKKITKDECKAALADAGYDEIVYIDFEIGEFKLSELYDLPFDNIALAQQRQYNETVVPVLLNYADADIAYFGLTPIPIAFHLGYLMGNVRFYTIYQWHHADRKWYREYTPADKAECFELLPLSLPQEVQKGSGEVVIRISTSFAIDPHAPRQIVPNPANEFDIALKKPSPDSIYDQHCFQEVVEAFQQVLNAYANKLSDREQIHLFMACAAGLPFALGTRINPTIYPFVQTYQFSRDRDPKYKDAILVSRETNEQVVLSEQDRQQAKVIRNEWADLLQNKLKAFINMITGKEPKDWFDALCETAEEYTAASKHLRSPWNEIIHIGKTSLKSDSVDMEEIDVQGGFEYVERTNSWQIDDGFLVGLDRRLSTKKQTCMRQAARLFFFHEALHYAEDGHCLTQEIADGIGRFPKVIEDADYQADAWALLTEYRYCKTFEPDKLKIGIKDFFCNAIDTAVETMWSFVDNGSELEYIQIRSMNRFINWYWQWVRIESLSGQGTLEQVVKILFEKPVIEFAGAPMILRAHRTFYRLNKANEGQWQIAAFLGNKVYRFTPNLIESFVDGFRKLNDEKIKKALRSFYNMVPRK